MHAIARVRAVMTLRSANRVIGPPKRDPYGHRNVRPITLFVRDPRIWYQHGLATRGARMMNGDCLVTKRSDGRFDVFKVTPSGAPLPVRRDIPDGIMAWLVAQARLAPTGGDVYY